MGINELGLLLTIVFGVLGVVYGGNVVKKRVQNKTNTSGDKKTTIVIGSGNNVNQSDHKGLVEEYDKRLSVHTTAVEQTPTSRAANDVYVNKHSEEKVFDGQSNLFYIAGKPIGFIPIICSWNRLEDEYYYGDILIQTNFSEYSLPQDMMDCFDSMVKEQVNEREYILKNIYETKVRIDDYSVNILGGKRPHQIIFKFSKATYRDFLIARKVMDSRLKDNITTREKYFNYRQSLISRTLPNVCGVGIFIITADNKILLSKSSKNVVVNPERFLYTASGSMNWQGQSTNPFADIVRECKEEIAYQPNIENTILYSFGIDYESGYYQFSFYEQSDKTADEIIEDATMGRDFNIELQKIVAVDFKYKEVIDFINANDWDETAKANLITLIVKKYSKKIVENYIDPNRKKEDYRKKVLAEWERRSQREGRLAVLSNRYSAIHIDEISENYRKQVLKFIDEDLSDKSVIEVGGGIGIFTKYFAENARKITCVDVSEHMIKRNKAFLGEELAQKVNYVNCFFQDYNGSEHYDILICSLVLIHNADELQEMVTNMKRLANVIYLFEHVEDGAQVSIFTEPKTKKEYINLFPEYDVEKTDNHFLSVDDIAFIKLVRRGQ